MGPGGAEAMKGSNRLHFLKEEILYELEVSLVYLLKTRPGFPAQEVQRQPRSPLPGNAEDIYSRGLHSVAALEC